MKLELVKNHVFPCNTIFCHAGGQMYCNEICELYISQVIQAIKFCRKYPVEFYNIAKRCDMYEDFVEKIFSIVSKQKGSITMAGPPRSKFYEIDYKGKIIFTGSFG